MRKLILWMTALILLVTACVPAFASVGDRVLMHESSLADVGTMYVEDVLPCGNGLYLIVNDQRSKTVRRYADLQAEPEEYEWVGEKLPEAAEEEEPVTINIIEAWFVRGEELYALTANMTIGGAGNRVPELSVRHVKLADGKVILEESDLPELDLSGLIMEDGDYVYSKGIRSKFTADDKLFLTVFGESSDELIVIDLQDGTGTAIELDDDVNEIAPGPEGSVLMTRSEWEADSTVTVRISRLDPEDRSETELAEIEGLTFTRIAPNYSAEKDTLYYYKAGELWAMPHFDAAQAEAVNDCPDNGNGSFLLPNGFVVIWNYDTVMARNTDPAQRSSVTLHVMEFADGMAVTEALYEMNNQRGDISVVEQRDWSKKKEILQAMLNRDSSTDIYLYEYDSNEFQALYNRDYLPDLSGNAKIAESTDRLYPYLQEAVKQNGKIIGVPVNLWGYVPGIHMEQWKGIGGTEEELPKTWSQFFDWLESLPERIEGKDVYLAPWADRVSFRADILEIMLNQYEIRMERKGETDYAFANPELCELVRRLNNLDYDALKIAEPREEEESEQEEYIGEGYDHDPLLETYDSSVLNGDPGYVPLALSFSENEEPVLPVEMGIAFMNPYCEHPREAMEFLACMAEKLSVYDAYASYTDQTEPVHRPGYEEEKKAVQDLIDKLNQKLGEAEEEDREALEERIREAEERLEDNERYGWLISPEEIERYQKWQDYFKVRGYSFLNVLFENEEANDEAESDYEKLFYSEESAEMSPEELLGMLDQKVRMIRMERN